MKTAKNEYNNAGRDAVKEYFKEKKYFRKEMAKVARFSKSNQNFMKSGDIGMATQTLMDIKFYIDNVLEEIADEFEMPYILDHKIKEAKVYSKADGVKLAKQLKKSGDAKVYKVIKDKTKISGKNVMMYQLWTKNVQQTSMSNPYGVEMLRSGRKAAYLIPVQESVNEGTIKFSKEEMIKLHKDGKIEKDGHTIEFNESARKTR